MFEYRNWLDDETGVSWTDDDESILLNCFDQWLKNEFDNVLPNAEKESDADAHIDEIRSIATQYFDLTSFSERFESIQRDVYEHFNGFEPDWNDYREMNAARKVASSEYIVELDLSDQASENDGPPASAETRQSPRNVESSIDALFNHLR